jgi:hypothetical protein
MLRQFVLQALLNHVPHAALKICHDYAKGQGNHLVSGLFHTDESVTDLWAVSMGYHDLESRLDQINDAIQAAADMAGIEGKPEVLYPKEKKPSLFDFIIGSSLQTIFEQRQGVTAEYIMFR